jgi:hypothetical protein
MSGGRRCRLRDLAGEPFAFGRRQVTITDCSVQSVIITSQSAHIAEYLRPINSSSSRAGIAQKRQFWRCLPCGVLRDRIVLAAPSRCCAGRCRRAWTRALLTTDFRACRQHDGSGRPKPGQRRYQAGKPQLPLVMAASCPGHGGRARSPDQRVHASRRTPATAARPFKVNFSGQLSGDVYGAAAPRLVGRCHGE